ncbi:pyridoxamine 5'-phosphate oxidase family protein [Flavobacterium sp. 3HN19-14]|uniref:pyridoxamine 5'-phosphate oxidase family protein n=1 Tax=Flavobacterium sp. 3HN19-14 TaxID=3448133 RepID=UPI003EE38376
MTNLTSSEAVAKLKELAEDVGICMFCTDLTTLPITTRPMGIREVDDQGNLWFMSSKKSNKNFEIKADDRVQLLFAKIPHSHYLSVYGNATIYKDKSKIDELWTPIANAWFEEGKDDPDVSVIKVVPSDVYYWDTKDGKLVSLIKMAVAAITGNPPDDGVEGNITVSK